MQNQIVSEIWIYPVKSLGGIPLSHATVYPKGIEHDRRWMLIDENNMAMTQRAHPKMALFKVSKRDDGFLVHYGNDLIGLPFTYEKKSFEAAIWNDKVQVHEVSHAHSDWFSQHLGAACKLVAFPEQNQRPVDANYAFNNDQVSLADAYPLLVIGQASLDDLNNRMKVKLPMNRFRPNIVFTGGQPYEEDNWNYFRIGSSRFAAVKPCARCSVTTVDQQTAIKGVEPLSTLATYRKKDNAVYFGQNLLVLSRGEFKVGDRVELSVVKN